MFGQRINGNSRILRGTVPYKAIFCWDIPLHRPYIGLIYGRYLQSIGSWNGHWTNWMSFSWDFCQPFSGLGQVIPAARWRSSSCNATPWNPTRRPETSWDTAASRAIPVAGNSLPTGESPFFRGKSTITHRIHGAGMYVYIYIYANIWGILMVNVTIYSIYGFYG